MIRIHIPADATITLSAEALAAYEDELRSKYGRSPIKTPVDVPEDEPVEAEEIEEVEEAEEVEPEAEEFEEEIIDTRDPDVVTDAEADGLPPTVDTVDPEEVRAWARRTGHPHKRITTATKKLYIKYLQSQPGYDSADDVEIDLDDGDEDDDDILGGEPTVTRDDVKKLATKLMGEEKTGELKAALRKLGIKKLSDVPEDKLSAFYTELKSIG